MANNILILIITLATLGWIVISGILLKTVYDRQKELNMIEHIKADLNYIRDELKKLK